MVKKKIEEMPLKETEESVAVDRVAEIEQWPLARLKPYKRNSKRHPPAQIALLARIISKHGFDQPIVVDGKGVIVKGHGRWLAAKELGLPTVPVVVRNLTGAQAAEARIADNRVAEFGWDFEALVADVVGNLQDGLDPETIGFSLKDLGLENPSPASEDETHAETFNEQHTKATEQTPSEQHYKSITVHFRSRNDLALFADLVKQRVTKATLEILFSPGEAA